MDFDRRSGSEFSDLRCHHKFLRDEHGLCCVGGRIEDAAGFGTFVEYEEFRIVGFAEGIATGLTHFK